MGDFLTILLGISLSGSMSFTLLLIMRKSFNGYSVWLYRLMKVLLVFYLVPVVLLAMVLVKYYTAGRIISIDSLDFSIGYLKLKTLTFAKIYRYHELFLGMSYIWGVGASATAVITIIWGQFYVRKILRCSTVVQEPGLLRLCETLAQEVVGEKKVDFFVCPGLISPFTAGIWHPYIILPTEEFSHSEWELLLRHELTHIKSRDVSFKQLAAWARVIHWFNPLVYLFIDELFEASEMACDEGMIGNAGKKVKRFYAELLVKLLDRSVRLQENVMLASFVNSEKAIKRRLGNCMKEKDKSRGKRVLMMIFSAVMVAACPLVSYASAVGILMVQDRTAEHILVNDSESEAPVLLVEHNGTVLMREDETYAMNLSSRGDNRIDITIEKGDRFWIDADLNSSSIDVVLLADSSVDSFRVGYTSESGMKYVDSVKGGISHSFSIIPGRYSIYIENKSDHDIHISGRITV